MTSRISLVTVVLNDVSGIQRTYESLPTLQASPELEWVVIDGLSTDGTIEWLQALTDPRLILHSNPDDGIFDAMNIGTRLASNEYIMFLNAGDELSRPEILREVEPHLKNSVDLAYGAAIEVARTGHQQLRPARSVRWVSRGMFTHHQAMFFRRDALLLDPYDTRFRLAGDYELIARWYMSGATFRELDRTLVRFHLGGRSDRHRIAAIREDTLIRRRTLKQSRTNAYSLAALHLIHLVIKRLFPSLTQRLRTWTA